MKWYLDVLRKYVEFDGRARRMEYWMFYLFNTIFAFACVALDAVVTNVLKISFSPFYLLYALAVLLPGLAVTVRRLHDSGKSGWWILIAFVPCVGPIVLLVFMIMDSEPGRNQFGPNPISAGRRAVDRYDDEEDDEPRGRRRTQRDDDEDDDYEERPRRRDR